MFPYDAPLADAVENAPNSVPDVIRFLQTIDGICSNLDGLKWFNRLYLEVTQAIASRVTAGGFNDTAWLAQLDVRFANLYVSALRAFLNGGSIPGCWRIVFQARDQVDLARIQFALAGVNAHINHDLADALVATCEATGSTPDRRGPHYPDYIKINPIIDGLIETAKRELNVRQPGAALPPVTHLEDTIAAWNVAAAREAAWQGAEHLWQLRSIPGLAAGYLDTLDGLTTVIGKALLVAVP